MNIQVVYCSKTGNTKKIAESIASVANCNAQSINSFDSKTPIDLLFIGGAIYATHNHNIDPELENFIKNIDEKQIKKVAVFCTGFSDDANYRMKNLLKQKNIEIVNQSFMCKGKLFLIFNFGHPNNKDIESAKKFAKNVINS